VAAGQIVEDDDIDSLGQERADDVGADIAGPSGYKPSHVVPLRFPGNRVSPFHSTLSSARERFGMPVAPGQLGVTEAIRAHRTDARQHGPDRQDQQ
jgi:hypothetical protein